MITEIYQWFLLINLTANNPKGFYVRHHDVNFCNIDVVVMENYATCLHRGKRVDCSKNIISTGALIKFWCNNSIVTRNCMSYGEWDEPMPQCERACGKPMANISTMIARGSNSKFGESPWHVAIYDVTLHYRLICGGTIITPNLVISAAHCFYDSDDNTYRSASDFIIFVSKITRKHTIRDNEATKMYGIRELFFTEDGYSGLSTYYSNDIVLARTTNEIQLSAAVLPACIDWYQDTRYVPKNSAVAKADGWGIDETGRTSETLKSIALEYVIENDCRKISPKEFEVYITWDKFCVKSSGQSTLEDGDSGSGFIEFDNGIYRLRGIASVKENSNSVYTFTDLASHIAWVKNISKSTSGNIVTESKYPYDFENINIAGILVTILTASVVICAIAYVIKITSRWLYLAIRYIIRTF